MKKICLNCVFFCKEYNPHKSLIKENERVKANNKFEFARNYALACFRGQWDEGVTPEIEKERDQLKHKTCNFFYDYKKARGKTFQACIEDQREECAREKEKAGYRHFIILALIGLATLTVAILLSR